MKGPSKTEIIDVGESGFFDDDDGPLDNNPSYGGYAQTGGSNTHIKTMNLNNNNNIIRGGNQNINRPPYQVNSSKNISNNRQPQRNMPNNRPQNQG